MNLLVDAIYSILHIVYYKIIGYTVIYANH